MSPQYKSWKSLSIKHHDREMHLAAIKHLTSQCQHVAQGALVTMAPQLEHAQASAETFPTIPAMKSKLNCEHKLKQQ